MSKSNTKKKKLKKKNTTHIQKIFHDHEARLTHSNKISASIKNKLVQPSLHNKCP